MDQKERKSDRKLSFSKCLWWVVCFCALTGFVYESFLFLQSYYSYPSVVNVYIDRDHPPVFPDVTFCSYSRYSRKNIVGSKFCEINKNELFCYNPAPPLPPAITGSGRVIPPPKNSYFCKDNIYEVLFCPVNGTSYSKICNRSNSSLYQNLQEREIEQILSSFVSKTSINERIEFGFQAKDLIQKCTFMGSRCDYRNFSLVLTNNFGNCYTFHGFDTGKGGIPVKGNGPLFGLKFHLMEPFFIRNMPEVTQVQGFRLMVHERGAAPFPDHEGIDIQNGLQTSVGLKQTIKKWLKYPHYPNCTSIDISHYFKPNGSKFKYSIQLCEFQCMQKIIWDHCQCIDSRLYISNSIYDGPACNVNNYSQACCMENILKKLHDGVLGTDCDCPVPCKITGFTKTISSLKLSEFIYRSDQTAAIQIYFESTEVRVDESKPKYEPMDIFSNIGGQIGLFLGVSIIAFYEVIESAILDLIKNCKKRKNKTSFEVKQLTKEMKNTISLEPKKFTNETKNRISPAWTVEKLY